MILYLILEVLIYLDMRATPSLIYLVLMILFLGSRLKLYSVLAQIDSIVISNVNASGTAGQLVNLDAINANIIARCGVIIMIDTVQKIYAIRIL